MGWTKAKKWAQVISNGRKTRPWVKSRTLLCPRTATNRTLKRTKVAFWSSSRKVRTFLKKVSLSKKRRELSLLGQEVISMKFQQPRLHQRSTLQFNIRSRIMGRQANSTTCLRSKIRVRRVSWQQSSWKLWAVLGTSLRLWEPLLKANLRKLRSSIALWRRNWQRQLHQFSCKIQPWCRQSELNKKCGQIYYDICQFNIQNSYSITTHFYI